MFTNRTLELTGLFSYKFNPVDKTFDQETIYTLSGNSPCIIVDGNIILVDMDDVFTSKKNALTAYVDYLYADMKRLADQKDSLKEDLDEAEQDLEEAVDVHFEFASFLADNFTKKEDKDA